MAAVGRSIRRLVAFACPLIVAASMVAAPRLAHGDDDPRKKAAEATFQEGVRLHQQGKNQEALAKLKKAYDTYPSPNTLGGIARVEQAMGRSLEALRDFREAARNPLMHPENAEHARSAIKELERELARVDVKGPKGLGVTIDGNDYVLPLSEPIDVKAQTLTLSGTLAGVRYEARVTAPIGRVTEIEMVAADGSSGTKPPPAIVIAPVTTHPIPAPARPFWDAGRITGVALFGVGVAGAVTGVVFGARSNDAADRANELQSRLGPTACGGQSPAPDCASLRESRSDQDRDSTLSTVFLAGGAAFAVAGAVSFFWPRSDVRLAPSASQDGGSLTLTSTF